MSRHGAVMFVKLALRHVILCYSRFLPFDSSMSNRRLNSSSLVVSLDPTGPLTQRPCSGC